MTRLSKQNQRTRLDLSMLTKRCQPIISCGSKNLDPSQLAGNSLSVDVRFWRATGVKQGRLRDGLILPTPLAKAIIYEIKYFSQEESNSA
jgi:hypothetical protein